MEDEFQADDMRYRRLTHRLRSNGAFFTKIGESKLLSDHDAIDGLVLVFLRDEQGLFFACPKREFEDGRFEELK